MFIKVTQSGQRRYAQLVESFRNEDGRPRQPVFDSYARKWLISLDSELKRAPTRGSSAGFDWVA